MTGIGFEHRPRDRTVQVGSGREDRAGQTMLHCHELKAPDDAGGGIRALNDVRGYNSLACAVAPSGGGTGPGRVRSAGAASVTL